MTLLINFPRPESFQTRWLRASELVNLSQVKEALEILEGLAAEGYSEACVEIGNILERGGNGVAQDLESARFWYLKAIEDCGDSFGYVGLARLAINGFGEAGTKLDAVKYLEMAIRENNPVALTILGTLYHAGEVIPRDLKLAEGLYRKACEQGYVLPLAYLSRIQFEQGRFIASVRSRLAAIIRAWSIVRHDRDDPRLWNYIDR